MSHDTENTSDLRGSRLLHQAIDQSSSNSRTSSTSIKIEVYGVDVGSMRSLYRLGYNGSRVVVFVITFYEPLYINI